MKLVHLNHQNQFIVVSVFLLRSAFFSIFHDIHRLQIEFFMTANLVCSEKTKNAIFDWSEYIQSKTNLSDFLCAQGKK